MSSERAQQTTRQDTAMWAVQRKSTEGAIHSTPSIKHTLRRSAQSPLVPAVTEPKKSNILAFGELQRTAILDRRRRHHIFQPKSELQKNRPYQQSKDKMGSGLQSHIRLPSLLVLHYLEIVRAKDWKASPPSVLVRPLITLSSAHSTIATQSFTTIHRTAVIASSRSTTVPAMMPVTYSLACCVSR